MYYAGIYIYMIILYMYIPQIEQKIIQQKKTSKNSCTYVAYQPKKSFISFFRDTPSKSKL